MAWTRISWRGPDSLKFLYTRMEVTTVALTLGAGKVAKEEQNTRQAETTSENLVLCSSLVRLCMRGWHASRRRWHGVS